MDSVSEKIIKCILRNSYKDGKFDIVAPNTSLNGLEKESAFSEQIEKSASESIVEFQNLSKNARLVVPCPVEASANYCHLASFTRSAPIVQQHSLWECVGEIMQQSLSHRPVWLSTAGAGVAWLHIRLDETPKYYSYNDYREMP